MVAEGPFLLRVRVTRARRPQLADKHRSMTAIESNALRPVLAESCRLYIHNGITSRKGNFAA